MRADALDITGAGSGLTVSIALIRGTQVIAAQNARLYGSGAGTSSGAGTESAQTSIRVVGAPWMNIRARDRFTHDGVQYEVVAVMPQRHVATVAQVRSLQ
jgi:hypothetical protein